MKDPVTHWDSRTCELCGSEGHHVRPTLACYADDGRFERIDRCTDHQSCEQRVRESGEEWLLVEVSDRWVQIR